MLLNHCVRIGILSRIDSCEIGRDHSAECAFLVGLVLVGGHDGFLESRVVDCPSLFSGTIAQQSLRKKNQKL